MVKNELPNLLVSQEMNYPTHFSSVPTRGINSERSLMSNARTTSPDGYSECGYTKAPTISDNNIGQWLPFPPYPLPNVVLQVQKNIERKVDIIVATLKEGKRGRAFF